MSAKNPAAPGGPKAHHQKVKHRTAAGKFKSPPRSKKRSGSGGDYAPVAGDPGAGPGGPADSGGSRAPGGCDPGGLD
jgi:hypothetical protein